MSYIAAMKRALFLLTVGAFLSLTASHGLLADSKKLRKPKSTVSKTEQALPPKTHEIDLTDEHAKAPAIPQTEDGPREGEEVNWRVMSSGGRRVVGEDLVISGTMGQFAIGSATSGDIGVRHGYWQDFGKSYVCGDANGSGEIDIDDAVYIIDYAFNYGPEPIPYESADANCSAFVDIDDVVYILNYVFNYGPAPCDPDGDGVPDC
jgi:hypothetical protein